MKATRGPGTENQPRLPAKVLGPFANMGGVNKSLWPGLQLWPWCNQLPCLGLGGSQMWSAVPPCACTLGTALGELGERGNLGPLGGEFRSGWRALSPLGHGEQGSHPARASELAASSPDREAGVGGTPAAGPFSFGSPLLFLVIWSAFPGVLMCWAHPSRNPDTCTGSALGLRPFHGHWHPNLNVLGLVTVTFPLVPSFHDARCLFSHASLSTGPEHGFIQEALGRSHQP